MLRLTGLGVFAAALMVASGQPASARFYDPALQAAAPAAEPVACRMVRERIERPNGRVIFRSKRVCTPGLGMGMRFGGDRDCKMVRERIERPNGSVVYRSTRRCR